MLVIRSFVWWVIHVDGPNETPGKTIVGGCGVGWTAGDRIGGLVVRTNPVVVSRAFLQLIISIAFGVVIDFGDLMRQRTEFILPLTPDELEQAIVRPVSQLGLMVAPDLIAEMTRDVGGQPGALPLLQYALTELFERREGAVFTLASYRDSGGVMAALGRRADEIYANLDDAQQQAAKQLFLVESMNIQQ